MFSMKRSGFLRSFSGAVAPPGLLKRRFDEADKQRVRPVRAAFKLRMILHAHIKRPITQLHGLHRMSVRQHAGERYGLMPSSACRMMYDTGRSGDRPLRGQHRTIRLRRLLENSRSDFVTFS